MYYCEINVEKKGILHEKSNKQHWLFAFHMLYLSLLHISRWLLTTHDARKCVVVLNIHISVFMYTHVHTYTETHIHVHMDIFVGVRAWYAFSPCRFLIFFFRHTPQYFTIPYSYTPVSLFNTIVFLRGGKFNVWVSIYMFAYVSACLYLAFNFRNLYLCSIHTHTHGMYKNNSIEIDCVLESRLPNIFFDCSEILPESFYRYMYDSHMYTI